MEDINQSRRRFVGSAAMTIAAAQLGIFSSADAQPGSVETRTVNMPHYMFYAPNLTSKDIGGGPVMGRYPYLINPGPHAYMIVNVGEAEKAQMNQEESDLLRELCTYRTDFCMDTTFMKARPH